MTHMHHRRIYLTFGKFITLDFFNKPFGCHRFNTQTTLSYWWKPSIFKFSKPNSTSSKELAACLLIQVMYNTCKELGLMVCVEKSS